MEEIPKAWLNYETKIHRAVIQVIQIVDKQPVTLHWFQYQFEFPTGCQLLLLRCLCQAGRLIDLYLPKIVSWLRGQFWKLIKYHQN